MRSGNVLLAAALGGLVAAPVMAGGVAPVVVEPAPVVVVEPVAVAANWTGFYGGLSYGKLDGEFSQGNLNNDLDSSSNPSLFAGWNAQSGNLVYGGELGYHFIGDAVQKNAPAGEEGLGNVLDLHGRVGFAAGQALIYSRVGYSMTNYETATNDYDLDGLSYGVGVDFLVTDNVFLGLDYTKRDLEGDNNLKLDASTLGLRVGYKF